MESALTPLASSPSASAANARVSDPNAYIGPPGRGPKHLSYGEAGLAGEVAKLDPLAVDRRRDHYIAAIKMGSLVGGGELNEAHALRALVDAAAARLGSPVNEAMKHMRRGLKKGIRSPRSAPAWKTIKSREEGAMVWVDWWQVVESDRATFAGRAGRTSRSCWVASTSPA